MNKLAENNSLDSISSILKVTEDYKQFVKSYSSTTEAPLQFFQKIAVFTSDYVRAVEEYYNKTKPPKLQCCEIVVHLMKICSTCELFNSKYLNLNSTLQEEDITELMRCICRRLTTLLENSDELLCAVYENENDIGIFVKLMNTVLEKVLQIDIDEGYVIACSNLDEARNMIEEILCFSMAIAQVAMDDDPKIITAGCRLVLNSLESIKIEIQKEKPNRSMCNLVVDNCSDALCALETQVNIAVLRLCFKVFSNYKQPLDSLTDKACNNLLIANFDLNMDRIFQIAVFSIGSSAVGKGVATIKAIMGNLEFLEAELIPIIITKAGNEPVDNGKTFIDVLIRFWCEQVKCLRKTIHMIIEPSAYCKLIYEELQIKTDELWLTVSNAKVLQICQLNPFIKYTQELLEMITACFESFKTDQQEKIKKRLKIVKCVLRELKSCEAAMEQQVKTSLFISNYCIFKRCKILLKAIKELWLAVANKNEQDIFFEDKVQSVYESSIAEDNEQLTYIINKSKYLVKARTPYSTNQTACIMATANNDLTVIQGKTCSRKPAYNNSVSEFSIVNGTYSIIMEAKESSNK